MPSSPPSSSWDYPDDEPAAGTAGAAATSSAGGGDRRHQVVDSSNEFTTSSAASSTSSNTGGASAGGATAGAGAGGAATSAATWFGNLMTKDLNFRSVAHCLTDAVHRTAVAVAHEIAMLEERMEEGGGEEQAAGCGGGGGGGGGGGSSSSSTETKATKKMKTTGDDDHDDDDDDDYHHGSLVLPWEINVKSASKSPLLSPLSPLSSSWDPPVPVYVTDNALMKEILALSLIESNFREPPSEDSNGTNTSEDDAPTLPSRREDSMFVLDEPRLELIRRLLDIDPNLASMHARLSNGEKKEEEIGFWKNYFLNCDRVRRRYGVSQETSPTRKDSPGTIINNYFQSSNDDNNDDMIETVVASNGMRSKLDRMVSSLAEDDNENTDSYDDDESLVPASTGDEKEEEDNDHDNGDDLDGSSYVIASAPTSANTFDSTRSIDDVVLVNKDKGRSSRR